MVFFESVEVAVEFSSHSGKGGGEKKKSMVKLESQYIYSNIAAKTLEISDEIYAVSILGLFFLLFGLLIAGIITARIKVPKGIL